MNIEEMEERLAKVDLLAPPPDEEPERQYYYIAKLRKWADAKKEEF